MKEWARQQIAEKQRLEAVQAAHAQEVARLKAENERIKAQAEADKQKIEAERKEAAINARLQSNKADITEKLTAGFYRYRQDIMDSANFKGTLVSYEVDDILVSEKILYTSHIMIWKNADGTGGFGRYFLAYDLRTEQWVGGQASNAGFIPADKMRRVMNDLSGTTPPLETKTSVWTPTNETVNTGYKAAIGVGAGILTVIIQNVLSGN
jgi:hypothetical protein